MSNGAQAVKLHTHVVLLIWGAFHCLQFSSFPNIWMVYNSLSLVIQAKKLELVQGMKIYENISECHLAGNINAEMFCI